MDFTILLTLIGSFIWLCFPTMIFVVIGTIVFIFIIQVGRKPQNESWEELATQLGLTFTPGSFTRRSSLSGEYRGRDVRIYTVRRGTSDNRRSYTAISLGIKNPARYALSLSGQGLFTEIAKSFGMQDIQINDKEFDNRFIIKSQPESFAIELFKQGSLRRHLLQARSINIRINEDLLVFEKRYVETDISYLIFLLDMLNHLADACERITIDAEVWP